MTESTKEIHKDEFQALPLLLQHRRLLLTLDELDEELDRLRGVSGGLASSPCDEWCPAISAFLESFIRDLSAHFEVESRSTAAIFNAPEDAARRAELEILDREHPDLLRSFQGLETHLKAGDHIDRTQFLFDLESAIAAFREHEAREDELFADD